MSSTTAGVYEELLAPISAELPAGEDASGTDEWLAIREARRADDTGNQGAWERERKESNWRAVHDLASAVLSRRAKDLRVALWLTEASVHLQGWQGLHDSLVLLRRLVEDFWTLGLYPQIEDGEVRYRAVPLEWLGDKLALALRQIPLTARSDSDRDYSLSDSQQARQVGFERDLLDENGYVDEARKLRRQSALASNGVTGEMFETAVRATRRASVERVSGDLNSVREAFSALQTILEEKLEDDAPNLSESREVLSQCRDLIDGLLRTKRAEEPDPVADRATSDDSGTQPGSNSSPALSVGSGFALADGVGQAWAAAEQLIQAGKLQQGLAEMTRLAAAEHGRSRFLRKLALAEICKAMKRDRLAVAVLEELATQIDTLHLDEWESTDLVARIWGLLFQYHRAADPGTDQAARAAFLFDKLCKLDPWQALHWEN